jgi:hypothetical protein
LIRNSSSINIDLHVDISLELMNVDGVTKRRVEKDAELDDGCGIIAESDTVFDD